MVSETEVLRACNIISCQYGGAHVGLVQGNRNQWLISVGYYGGGYGYVGFGFCQTQIKRAPTGGFLVTIGEDILNLCRNANDVIGYFDMAILGTAKECKAGHKRWMAEREEVSSE